MDDEQGTSEMGPECGADDLVEMGPERGAADPLEMRSERGADDPAWRLTGWLLPCGAGGSALLVAAQALAGTLDGRLGVVAAAILALLCAAMVRDAQRRARTGRWVREEVHEYMLPLALLLVTLVLLARGADLLSCVPALLVLLPVVWEIVHAPGVERVARLWPYALPVLNEPAEPPAGDEEVERIVRDVLDGLPPDIAAQLRGWTIEVQDEMRPGYAAEPPGEIVFGCCFGAANVIAIYWRPHRRVYRRGEPLRRAVTYTVLHEIAHALGLDETGVRRLGWLAEQRPPPELEHSLHDS